MYSPKNYNKINLSTGSFFPSSVKMFKNASYNYWERSLYERMASTIDVIGLPDNWEGSVKDFFFWCLFRWGFVGIFDSDEFGLSFQPGSLSGYDLYYQYTKFKVSNPVLRKTFRIHEDCEILKLNPDFMGSWDIIAYTAAKLANLCGSIDTSIVNSRTPYILGASTKAAAETFRKVMELASQGQPAIVTDSKLLQPDINGNDPWKFLDLKVKDHYLLSEQLQDFATILSNFNAEIGIPALPYQKAERLVTTEANMRTYDASARSTTWVNCLNSSVELINDMFGTDIKFSLHYINNEVDTTLEGGDSIVNLQDNDMGT